MADGYQRASRDWNVDAMNKSVLKKAAILTKCASMIGESNCKICGGTGVLPFTMDDFCDCTRARTDRKPDSRKDLRQIDDPWKPSIEVDNFEVELKQELFFDQYKDSHSESLNKYNEHLND